MHPTCTHRKFTPEIHVVWDGMRVGAGVGGPEAMIVPVAFGLVFVLGLVGNGLVLAVLGRAKPGRARSVTNVLVLNLSLADLSFLVLCVPFQATIYTLPEWVFGALLCKWVHYFVTVTMLVSVFTLGAMAVDRYLAVVRARRSQGVRNTRNAALGVAAIWGLSLLLAVPVPWHQALLTGVQQAPNRTFCWEQWADRTHKQVYKATVLVVGYLLPLALICCLSLTDGMAEQVGDLKKTCTVMLVVAAFLLSWLPHHIITMWVAFGNFPITDASFVFRIIAHCMVYGNSCINPIIYAFLSENFRKACQQVFTCKCFLPPPIEEKVVRIRMETFSTTHSITNA
uniref:Galanin receptor 1b n=1 Tax=Callorhinchus milii TaxID=7868 RepID=A0A4W3K3T1_CALMI